MKKKLTVLYPGLLSDGFIFRRLLTVSRVLKCIGILCVSTVLFPVTIQAADDNKSQLQSIQRDIASKEKHVKAQKAQRSNLLSQLRNQETVIAQAARQLHQTQYALTSVAKDIALLNASIQQLQQQQQQQERLLSQQLDAAFRQGRQSGLQLILGGEEAQRSERILAGFGYINQARQHTISALQHTQKTLSIQKNALNAKKTQQQSLLALQKEQQHKLETSRVVRQKTLVTLETSLKKDQAQLLEMRQNESHLRDKIVRAEREAQARAEREAHEAEQIRQRQALAKRKGSVYKPSVSEQSLMARTGGLGRPSGQVSWPVRGTLSHRFGESLQGELRWKGLVINAPEGTEVKAIADGRVLMADWLQGYGLVVVIEHGKGDMSLYGYNQSALVSVGTQVRTGEPIALVGNSGGRGTPSLYFEIRRQGQAVNPLPWLGR
ncbi:murein hydrolase activator EnvC [Enterobacteriaceae bacterium LUAb1]